MYVYVESTCKCMQIICGFFFNISYILSNFKYTTALYIIYFDTSDIIDFFDSFLQKLMIIQTKKYIVHCMKFCNFACPIQGVPSIPGED